MNMSGRLLLDPMTSITYITSIDYNTTTVKWSLPFSHNKSHTSTDIYQRFSNSITSTLVSGILVRRSCHPCWASVTILYNPIDKSVDNLFRFSKSLQLTLFLIGVFRFHLSFQPLHTPCQFLM